jgi:hypothetical protein
VEWTNLLFQGWDKHSIELLKLIIEEQDTRDGATCHPLGTPSQQHFFPDALMEERWMIRLITTVDDR